MLRLFIVFVCLFVQRFSVNARNSHLGCFLDRFDENSLEIELENPRELNVRFCIDRCSEENFLYAAIRNLEECRCFKNFDFQRQINDDQCPFRCSDGEQCGGENRISVYDVLQSIDSPSFQCENLQNSYFGCFDASKFSNAVGFVDSLEKCLDLCRRTSRFAAVTNGNSCFCENEINDEPIDTEICSSPCSFQQNSIGLDCCGGSKAFSVFDLRLDQPLAILDLSPKHHRNKRQVIGESTQPNDHTTLATGSTNRLQTTSIDDRGNRSNFTTTLDSITSNHFITNPLPNPTSQRLESILPSQTTSRSVASTDLHSTTSNNTLITTQTDNPSTKSQTNSPNQFTNLSTITARSQTTVPEHVSTQQVSSAPETTARSTTSVNHFTTNTRPTTSTQDITSKSLTSNHDFTSMDLHVTSTTTVSTYPSSKQIVDTTAINMISSNHFTSNGFLSTSTSPSLRSTTDSPESYGSSSSSLHSTRIFETMPTSSIMTPRASTQTNLFSTDRHSTASQDLTAHSDRIETTTIPTSSLYTSATTSRSFTSHSTSKNEDSTAYFVSSFTERTSVFSHSSSPFTQTTKRSTEDVSFESREPIQTSSQMTRTSEQSTGQVSFETSRIPHSTSSFRQTTEDSTVEFSSETRQPSRASSPMTRTSEQSTGQVSFETSQSSHTDVTSRPSSTHTMSTQPSFYSETTHGFNRISTDSSATATYTEMSSAPTRTSILSSRTTEHMFPSYETTNSLGTDGTRFTFSSNLPTSSLSSVQTSSQQNTLQSTIHADTSQITTQVSTMSSMVSNRETTFQIGSFATGTGASSTHTSSNYRTDMTTDTSQKTPYSFTSAHQSDTSQSTTHDGIYSSTMTASITSTQLPTTITSQSTNAPLSINTNSARTDLTTHDVSSMHSTMESFSSTHETITRHTVTSSIMTSMSSGNPLTQTSPIFVSQSSSGIFTHQTLPSTSTLVSTVSSETTVSSPHSSVLTNSMSQLTTESSTALTHSTQSTNMISRDTSINTHSDSTYTSMSRASQSSTTIFPSASSTAISGHSTESTNTITQLTTESTRTGSSTELSTRRENTASSMTAASSTSADNITRPTIIHSSTLESTSETRPTEIHSSTQRSSFVTPSAASISSTNLVTVQTNESTYHTSRDSTINVTHVTSASRTVTSLTVTEESTTLVPTITTATTMSMTNSITSINTTTRTSTTTTSTVRTTMTTVSSSFMIFTTFRSRSDLGFDPNNVTHQEAIRTRITNIVTLAFRCQNDSTIPECELVQRRVKRDACPFNYSVNFLNNATQVSNTNASYRVFYTVTELCGSNQLIPASTVQMVTDRLPRDVITRILQYSFVDRFAQGTTAPETTTLASNDQRLWIIGAVLGPIAFILLLIGICLCVHFKCRPRFINPNHAQSIYNAPEKKITPRASNYQAKSETAVLQQTTPFTQVHMLTQNDLIPNPSKPPRYLPPIEKKTGPIDNQHPAAVEIPMQQIRQQHDVERWRNKLRLHDKFEKRYADPLIDLERVRTTTPSPTRSARYQQDTLIHETELPNTRLTAIDHEAPYESGTNSRHKRQVTTPEDVESGRVRLHRLLDEVLDQADGSSEYNPDSIAEQRKRLRQRPRISTGVETPSNTKQTTIDPSQIHIPFVAQVQERPSPTVLQGYFNPYEAGDRMAEIARATPVELLPLDSIHDDDTPRRSSRPVDLNQRLINPARSMSSQPINRSPRDRRRSRLDVSRGPTVHLSGRRPHRFDDEVVYVDSVNGRRRERTSPISVQTAWNEPSGQHQDKYFHISPSSVYDPQTDTRNDYRDEYLLAKRSVMNTKNLISSIQNELQHIVSDTTLDSYHA